MTTMLWIGTWSVGIGFVALTLWWAWRRQENSRYADTIDRRFAPYKVEPKVLLPRKPKPNRDRPAPDPTLEQRVTALEERADRVVLGLSDQMYRLQVQISDSPSRATEKATTDSPSAAGPETTVAPTQRYSLSVQPITNDGHVAPLYESAEPEDAST